MRTSLGKIYSQAEVEGRLLLSNDPFLTLEEAIEGLADVGGVPKPPEAEELQEGHRYLPVLVENLQVGDIVWFRGEALRVLAEARPVLEYHVFTVGTSRAQSRRA